MSTRDETIETAARAIRKTREFSAGAAFGIPLDARGECAEAIARAVIDAIQPTVSSVDELDALPVGSVLQDADSAVGVYLGNGELIYAGAVALFPSKDAALPATLLCRGGAV